ncbi:MAG: hypothetical protein A2275_07160 [Bacteroidetes bacterium RIFOXYA12_FULL_35_11]|nr:MAG: hypothetical protein A2X01_04485 [Bacteroidetes bacterium GWF2_35_48]OFY83202.1 MAG: hypothetical protein A2275_07160 [Bacteroidetes bacterium RIFOXYA12_FULL_35_11]OFY96225.1 MAG: hypothetical protein A2491_16155 [Bacteroidetes bacterium RIFOXYC12_FULL_35_7]OFY97054.1 MAG: hypothetical protein A2309_00650 [Bacteroidetes bacterium RIFOXYB2_FULL_35_7]HBX53269.1 hypothetical protein [Bacteroidales bacterium]
MYGYMFFEIIYQQSAFYTIIKNYNILIKLQLKKIESKLKNFVESQRDHRVKKKTPENSTFSGVFNFFKNSFVSGFNIILSFFKV